MIITCPECRVRCRIQRDAADSEGRGKCPECGHVLIIPPGTDGGDQESNQNTRRKKASPTPSWFSAINSFLTSTISHPQRIWIGATIILLLLALAGICLGPGERKKAAQAEPERPKVENHLDQQTILQLTEDLRQDPLVGDATIDFQAGVYYPALLVAGKTPVASAATLGRRFAQRLRESLPAAKRDQLAIEVSVYYPDGSRLLVSCHDELREEEILPRGEYPGRQSD